MSFFISYESQWATSAQLGPIKSDLINLEIELRKAITEIDEQFGQPVVKVDDKLYKYGLEVPETGSYNLYLYNKSTLSDQIQLTVNNRTFSAQRIGTNWYQITNVPLENVRILLELQKPKNSETRPKIFAELMKNAPEFVSPNIEFVALNQTKYLLKAKGSERFLLGFNSRFDPNWSLREIEQDVNKYF